MATTVESTTRDQILREAARLFVERGFHGASTRDIADAVGIRQPSLFHHFASKRAIMDELLAHNLEPGWRAAIEMAAADEAASVRLYRYLRADTAALLASPYDLSGLFDRVIDDPGFAAHRERYEELLAAVAQVVHQGIDGGEFLPMGAAFVAAAIDGINENTIRVAAHPDRGLLSRFPPVDRDGLPDQVATFVLRAILRQPSRVDRIRRQALLDAG
jgi:AcrR family transcriptional regulator